MIMFSLKDKQQEKNPHYSVNQYGKAKACAQTANSS